MAPTSHLPNFIVIGAQKAGSSTLHDLLSAHPQVFMSKQKELHYFDDCVLIPTFMKYQEAFYGAASFKAIGETTPSYLSYPGAAEKIRAVIGDIKIIAVLRDPVDRIYSQYWHNIKNGRETLELREAIDAEPSRLAQMGMSFFSHYAYLHRSGYETCLDAYKSKFSCVHVLRLEDIRVDAKQALSKLETFLQLDTSFQIHENKTSNPAGVFRSKLGAMAINRLEDSFGASRIVWKLRSLNTRRAVYPPLSQVDRDYLVESLTKTCPRTMKSYGYI